MDKIKKELEAEIKKINKVIKGGDKVDLLYDGKTIATYEFFERSIDSRSLLQWLRGCFVFEDSYQSPTKSHDRRANRPSKTIIQAFAKGRTACIGNL